MKTNYENLDQNSNTGENLFNDIKEGEEIILDDPMELFRYILPVDLEPEVITIETEKGTEERYRFHTRKDQEDYIGYVDYLDRERNILDGEFNIQQIGKLNPNDESAYRLVFDFIFIENRRNGRCRVTKQDITIQDSPIEVVEDGYYIDDELIRNYNE